MADTCKAKGKGWACDREAVCNGYCNTHNMQMVRNGEVRPIRTVRDGPRANVKVTVLLTPSERKKLGEHPSMAASEILRKALAKAG